MALSYFTESEAPRDFRISSTESEGHYTKCLLCYTVKKNFYCSDCVRTGNFVHSSMPYSDRFAEKQSKLLRLKANRKYILDRAEKLIAYKIKKDSLLTEAKQARDKVDLLRLSIEQRKHNIEKKKKELADLVQANNHLRRTKIPRYQKCVSGLSARAASQRLEAGSAHGAATDAGARLAALRRSRVRQLAQYIFPVYISLDTSDSIEDMEFIGSCGCGEDGEEGEGEGEAAPRARLHVVAPWLHADGDHQHVLAWAKHNKEAALAGDPSDNPLVRTVTALGFAAQFAILLAWILDVRLPYSLTLRCLYRVFLNVGRIGEFSNFRVSSGGLPWRVARVSACAAALCFRCNLSPAPPPALTALHTIAAAAAADDPDLGRAEAWLSAAAARAGAAWAAALGNAPDEPEPPEHLNWPETEEEEVSGRSPPPAAPAASLVTSAAASLAGLWRGWTK
ncbi:autophagy related protein 14 [Choristoneura fumiferana]|uniref:autophagy related protein 14 n=1 Tax=Choristoneura fumiferana TaxID=7141 RepID=UPI003D159E7D